MDRILIAGHSHSISLGVKSAPGEQPILRIAEQRAIRLIARPKRRSMALPRHWAANGEGMASLSTP
jgi:hypothetical protein